MKLSFKGLLKKVGLKSEYDNNDINLEDTSEINNTLLNSLSPDAIIEKEDYLQNGDNYTKTFYISSLKSQIEADDLREINELSDNIDISYFYEEIDNHKIEKELSKSISENTSKVNSETNKAHVKAKAQAQIDSAEKLLEQLAQRETKMFDLHILITINASSEKELYSLSGRIHSQLSSLGRVTYPRLKAKDAFDSNLPFATNKIPELTSNTISSNALSYFFPFHENEIIHEGGIIEGRNRTTGNIIKVNPKKLLNKHMFAVGISGSGKSTALYADMTRKKSMGDDIMVIDPKGEFGVPFEVAGGSWFKFSIAKGGNMLNMFDVPSQSIKVDESGNYKSQINPLRDHISSLMVSFNLMYQELTLDASNELTEVLIELYRDKGLDIDDDELDYSKLKPTDFPILTDLAHLIDSYEKKTLDDGSQNPKYNPERFKRLSNFRKGIEKYVTGLYAHVLNGHTNIEVKDKSLVSFDVSEVTEIKDLNRVVYYNVLTYIKKLILNGNGKSTQVYVDEAHYLADPKVPVAMENLFIMMKVFRSLNCGVTSATQSIQDFFSARDEMRNYGEAVIDQSVQRLFLPMQEKEVDEVNKRLNLRLSEEDKDFLKVRSGEKAEDTGKGFFYVGSKKVKIEILLTDLEKKVWVDKNYEDFYE
ncbi:VirB4 family type IV secretion system protein [Staphylococcus epidermidis]|uniref:VirB4 family type IV secretion system protein n=1 Tax=Staphylococcus epidermidis TaxID=1282 RepID=UPI0034D66919